LRKAANLRNGVALQQRDEHGPDERGYSTVVVSFAGSTYYAMNGPDERGYSTVVASFWKRYDAGEFNKMYPPVSSDAALVE
jgi:hypothetical protein